MLCYHFISSYLGNWLIPITCDKHKKKGLVGLKKLPIISTNRVDGTNAVARICSKTWAQNKTKALCALQKKGLNKIKCAAQKHPSAWSSFQNTTHFIYLAASDHIYIYVLCALMAHNWQKWKSTFLTCHCDEIDREAVGLKSSNYTLKIMIFVNM